MRGNEKVAFTAEAVAFMRASKNVDKFSKYFVSKETEKKFNFFGKIVPKSYFDRVFVKRIGLSRELDKLMRGYKPEQIVELACGYSPRGLVLTRRSSKLVYVETDFSSVIERKRAILKKNGIELKKNHHLVAIDSVKDDLSKKLGRFFDRKKKTLVVAETLTMYLNDEEHEFLVENIKKFLESFKNSAYLSHEGKRMLKRFFGKLLLFYRNVVEKTKSHRHFRDAGKIKSYFLGRGFRKVLVRENEEISQIFYLVEN
ncbi:MAG: class I SAM-dependent methyltransferase [Nanoarchaeota archaeon]|nr:class I SAM-dependent methyltransferase [Nanoarchaeota archaeon]MBU0977713.1 class I SAM-dependent methyltransferase [Nanoarchaeota archaeon]